MPRLALLAALAVVTAGCLQSLTPNEAAEGATEAIEQLQFLPQIVVDPGLAVNEPSIKVGADGAIWIAGPSGQIRFATRPQDAVTNADNGLLQGAIWKSTDGGATFQYMNGLAGSPYRGYPGGSDSDIAIDLAGTVYVIDQFNLANEFLMYTTDGGDTWERGHPLPTGSPQTDRQWIWPGLAADELYLVVNGNEASGIVVARTTDRAQTWTQSTGVTGYGTAPGPLVVTKSGVVAFGAIDPQGEPTVYVSTDEGKTFKPSTPATGHGTVSDLFPQTFSDLAGTIYFAWVEEAEGGAAIKYAYSKDDGATWSAPQLAFHQPGAGVFLWGVAGDAGRVAFSWYEAPDPAKEWYAHAAILLEADTPAPLVTHARLSDTPSRYDPPCMQGVGCTSGRELGDFQSNAVGPDGTLHVAYNVVAKDTNDPRVVYSKQAAGPKLIETPPTEWRV